MRLAAGCQARGDSYRSVHGSYSRRVSRTCRRAQAGILNRKTLPTRRHLNQETPMLTRRQMLFATGAGAAALLLPKARLIADDKPGFTLPPLPYPVYALEPHIDAETMT